MTLEVKRKDRESVQSLLHRFTRSIQQSGILFRAKKTRFKQRGKSRQMEKRAALRRVELKKEYEKLKKMGKSAQQNR